MNMAVLASTSIQGEGDPGKNVWFLKVTHYDDSFVDLHLGKDWEKEIHKGFETTYDFKGTKRVCIGNYGGGKNEKSRFTVILGATS